MRTERLNFAAIGKVLCAIAKVRTGFGKSDHPGSQGGLGKRGHGGTVNPLRNRKGGAGKPPSKVGAPQLYPDPTGKEQRIHPGLESCGWHREVSVEA